MTNLRTFVLLLVIASVSTSCFGDLVVTLDNAVTYTPGSISQPLQISVFDDDPGTEDRLLGWQLRLQVSPQVGATGMVTFAAPELPSSGYVLDGVNFGLNQVFGTVVFPNDDLTIFDFDSRPATTGVVVPGTPGARLIDVRLNASPDASGVWEVQAIGGLGNSEFTGTGLSAFEFGNLTAGNTVNLASVTAVPEPSHITILALLCTASCMRRRQRIA